MFLITGKYMNAVDAYTGNFLWKIEMPMTERVKWRYMDSRVYSRPYERNYIAASDTLYIIYEQEIHLVSTATGEELGVFTIPEEIASATNASIWTEVRLAGNYLCCVVGNTLACLDRKTGKLLWQRASTRDSSTYALGDTTLYGIDCTAPPNIFRGETTPRKESTLFRRDLKTGNENWSTIVEHATVPEQNPDIVFGSTADYKSTAVVLDVETGKVIDNGNWMNYKRGCSRVIGNCNLLTYRNSATEVFDYLSKTRINFDSVRAGCTANFLPAGGILNAPSFGHGCVCNYPTFASLALVNLPEIDTFKPAIVKVSEMQRSKPAADSAGESAMQPAMTGKEMDVGTFELIDAKLKPTKGGCVFSTTGEGVGFAVRKAPEVLTEATVHVDLPAKRISVKVAGKALTAKVTGNLPGITHYGYGGSNSDTFFTEIVVNNDGVEDNETLH